MALSSTLPPHAAAVRTRAVADKLPSTARLLERAGNLASIYVHLPVAKKWQLLRFFGALNARSLVPPSKAEGVGL